MLNTLNNLDFINIIGWMTILFCIGYFGNYIGTLIGKKLNAPKRKSKSDYIIERLNETNYELFKLKADMQTLTGDTSVNKEDIKEDFYSKIDAFFEDHCNWEQDNFLEVDRRLMQLEDEFKSFKEKE